MRSWVATFCGVLLSVCTSLLFGNSKAPRAQVNDGSPQVRSDNNERASEIIRKPPFEPRESEGVARLAADSFVQPCGDRTTLELGLLGETSNSVQKAHCRNRRRGLRG